MDGTRSIVFDCDGVLIASNGIKAAAFPRVLAGEPADRLAAFEHLRKARPDLSRHALFDRYYRDIAATPEWQERARAASLAFSAATREALVGCPWVPGAPEALRLAGQGGLPCAVVSAADRDDLRFVLQGRGILGSFVHIGGGEARKAEQLAALIRAGTTPAPVAFFGDAPTDMAAAEEAGCRFVFVSGASDWEEGTTICAARGHAVIADFSGFLIPD